MMFILIIAYMKNVKQHVKEKTFIHACKRYYD